MTCSDVRRLLPIHAYGDLSPAEAAVVADHLRECVACRAEAGALDQVRSALDVAPTPPVRVDVATLFRRDADRRARRWRRLAIAGAALAAGLLLVVTLRLHVTIGHGQLVIGWRAETSLSGEPKATTVAPPAVASGSPLNNHLDDRLKLLQELTAGLAADVDARDRQRQAEIAAVHARLDAVQRAQTVRWADAERTMSALYVAQFKRPEEKPNP
jgi:anti-sigma factor RsiW